MLKNKKSVSGFMALVLFILLLNISAFSAGVEIIIDDGMPGFEETAGKWTASAAAPGYNGRSSRWSTSPEGEVRYIPDNLTKGNWTVSVYKPVHENNTDKQLYTVVHNGKANAFEINVKIGESAWEELGTFDFAGSGDEFVSVTKPTAGNCMRVDAVKFVSTDGSADNSGGAVVPIPSSPPKQESIDVTPVGKFTNTGKWDWYTDVKGPIKNYPQIMVTSEVGAKAVYEPNITSVNRVRISAWKVIQKSGGDNDVKVEIKTTSKTDTKKLDLTAGESGWEELGIYNFDGYGKETVTLERTSSNGKTYASAFKFEILNSDTVVSDNVSVWQTLYVNVGLILDSEMDKAKVSFADLDGHWSKSEVEAVAAKGLVNGVDQNKFAPDNTLTRAEFTTLLVRALDLDANTASGVYTDVKAGDWFAEYVGAAHKAGLFASLPVDGGKFNPNASITREEIALLVYNGVKITKKDTSFLNKIKNKFDSYSDVKDVSGFAKDAFSYAVHSGVINGYTADTLAAKNTATRAEAAVMLKRFMQTFIWAGPPTSSSWEMTFQDEFDGTDLDWEIWASANDYSPHILSGRWKENVAVENGLLRLLTKKEDRGGAHWSSALVFVREKVFTQAYGYWEARYRYAPATGLNQSFWMSGYNGTLDFFELDINEGHYPDMLNMSLHAGDDGTGVKNDNSKKWCADEDLSRDFHTYACEWNDKEIIYYFDGKEVDRKNAYNAKKPTFPKFATAVMTWAGPVTDALDGTSMDVDYIRIYQKKP